MIRIEVKYKKSIINPQERQMPYLFNKMSITASAEMIRSVNIVQIKKMVRALDAVPWRERQWGHWLARNSINTKRKLGLGATTRNVKKTPKI